MINDIAIANFQVESEMINTAVKVERDERRFHDNIGEVCPLCEQPIKFMNR